MLQASNDMGLDSGDCLRFLDAGIWNRMPANQILAYAHRSRSFRSRVCS